MFGALREKIRTQDLGAFGQAWSLSLQREAQSAEDVTGAVAAALLLERGHEKLRSASSPCDIAERFVV